MAHKKQLRNQVTNDLRAKEGLKKQAKGNAIERLGIRYGKMLLI